MGTYKVKLLDGGSGSEREDSVEADTYKNSNDGQFVDFFVYEKKGYPKKEPVKRYRAADVQEITKET